MMILIMVALGLTAFGGILDMRLSSSMDWIDQHFSKYHAWKDGIFLLLLIIAVTLLFKK